MPEATLEKAQKAKFDSEASLKGKRRRQKPLFVTCRVQSVRRPAGRSSERSQTNKKIGDVVAYLIERNLDQPVGVSRWNVFFYDLF